MLVSSLLVFGLLVLAMTDDACLLQRSMGPRVSLIIGPAKPPEVPHDGVRVLQPLDTAELAKCATTVSKAKIDAANNSPALFAQRPSFGSDTAFSQEAAASTVQAARTDKGTTQQRLAFACAAGCKTREPQLEKSLAPWADWKQNSSGLEMIDALESFCTTTRQSTDPFVMAVLWKANVYLKGCKSKRLDEVSKYLIGPEDLSLALIFLFGAQHLGHLSQGPIAFGMYLSDYTSLLDKHLQGPGLPIFSYVGRDTSWLIPWPSSFTVMSTQDVEEWENEQKSQREDDNQPTTQKAWKDRESKAYWIGSVTGPWEFALDDGLMALPRLKLLNMSKNYPAQLSADWSSTAGYGLSWIKDASSIEGNDAAHGSRNIEDLTGIAKSTYKDVTDWQNFKYYVNLDGVVMGGRITKLLSLGGVVLQHQAGYTEHVDALMKPYEHYVPIEYDLSDLVEKVEWLQENDEEARRIADNGKKLAMERMRLEDHMCYVWRALEGLGAKTAAAPSTDSEVAKRLRSFKHVQIQEGGMRPTMEAFWGKKLERIATGDRKMTSRGIKLLQWTWNRMEKIWKELPGQPA